MADDLQSKATEMMKKVLTVGVGTFFMTEESVKKYLKEKKFPRDIAGNLLDTMGKRKEDFYQVLAKEVGSILMKSDLEKAISNFLEKHEVKISFSKKTGDQ